MRPNRIKLCIQVVLYCQEYFAENKAMPSTELIAENTDAHDDRHVRVIIEDLVAAKLMSRVEGNRSALVLARSEVKVKPFTEDEIVKALNGGSK